MKPTMQCLEAARKANSVMRNISNFFKNIEEEGFSFLYRTYNTFKMRLDRHFKDMGIN